MSFAQKSLNSRTLRVCFLSSKGLEFRLWGSEFMWLREGKCGFW